MLCFGCEKYLFCAHRKAYRKVCPKVHRKVCQKVMQCFFVWMARRSDCQLRISVRIRDFFRESFLISFRRRSSEFEASSKFEEGFPKKKTKRIHSWRSGLVLLLSRRSPGFETSFFSVEFFGMLVLRWVSDKSNYSYPYFESITSCLIPNILLNPKTVHRQSERTLTSCESAVPFLFFTASISVFS